MLRVRSNYTNQVTWSRVSTGHQPLGEGTEESVCPRPTMAVHASATCCIRVTLYQQDGWNFSGDVSMVKLVALWPAASQL